MVSSLGLLLQKMSPIGQFSSSDFSQRKVDEFFCLNKVGFRHKHLRREATAARDELLLAMWSDVTCLECFTWNV